MPKTESEILEELLSWTRFSQRQAFAEVLSFVLASRKDYEAFELSDGSRSQADIAKTVGLSQPTVSRLWTKWRHLGLVRDTDGKVAYLAKPSDLGVARPR